MKPNLFKYATSELSQDAFICWLLEWSKPQYQNVDPLLNGISTLLLKEFFTKANIPFPSAITKVDIYKQYYSIDILCVVNEVYPIIIEDKTNTKNHSGQLIRYFDKINQRYEEKNIIPIYFKTGDQSSYYHVLERGYSLFLREDFLRILNMGLAQGIKNEIYLDYTAHLQEIENRRMSYRNLPIDQWNHDSWIGFFKELQTVLKGGAWNYVANPSGGFMGFWWNGFSFEGGNIYLQLEEKKLCFKVHIPEHEKRKKLRNYLYREVIEESKKYNVEIVKPQRFGTGKYMTVAILKKEYRIAGNNSVMDLELTIANIKRVEHVIQSLKNNFII